MGKGPDVTVVIPVYNKSRYLKACLESVLCQTGITLEIICVDDCSSDGSPEIAAEVARTEPLLRFVRNSSNRGAAYSRNVGISLARGNYLQFTDADDLLPPGSLALLVELAKRTSSEVIRGTLETRRNGVSTPWPTEMIRFERTGNLLDLPELWIPWFHCCCLISRDLLLREKVEYPPLIAGEDPVFIARALTKARRICVTPRITYTYRQDDQRPRPELRTVLDYIEHAELVKKIFAGPHQRCWEAYREVIRADIKLLLSQAHLTNQEYKSLEQQIEDL